MEAQLELENVFMNEVSSDLLNYLIYASSSVYINNEDEHLDCSGSLIKYVSQFEVSNLVPSLADNFKDMSVWAKSLTLELLTRTNTPESLKAFMALLEVYSQEEYIEQFLIDLTGEEEEAVSLLFPHLLKYLNILSLSYSIKLYIWKCLTMDTLKSADIQTVDRSLLYEYESLKMPLISFQSVLNTHMWTKNYQSLRGEAGLLLDIFGYLDSGKVTEVLNDALLLNDNRLKFFAAISLLRKEEPVNIQVLYDIASDSETRNILYDTLSEMDLEDLFPKQFFNQVDFAESEMVSWLTFPTELGCVPTEILCEAIITKQHNDFGEVDYYVFKFKSDEEDWLESGWMAGVTGCYKRNNQPTTETVSYTFSNFEPWESKSPEEHLNFLSELLEKFEG